MALLFFLTSIVGTIFKYLTLRYRVHEGELVVTEGLLFHRVRTVPLRRIQNMDLVQNVFHRIFNVAEVRIETASGSKPEATLRVLTMDQITTLRREVFGHRQSVSEAEVLHEVAKSGSENDPFSVAPSLNKPGRTILEIPTSLLVKAGLSSNRGLILVGVGVGIFSQFYEFWEDIDFAAIGRMLPKFEGIFSDVVFWILLALGFWILLRIFGTVWYVLRFHGYRLVRIGEDLRISCGLLTKVSATVPRKRIQFISIHRPLLFRIFGLSSIRIETAGGAGKENEDATATVARRWFVPVIQEKQVNQILQELRPGLSWNEEQTSWQSVSKRTATRLCRIAIVISIFASAIGLIITRPWGFLIGVAVLPLFMYFAIRASRSMKYTRTDFGVAYRSGIFYRKLSLTFFERFQGLRIDQTPFDRRWKMATLSVDTAAAGPADHRVRILYLDEDFAKREFRELSKYAAQHRPIWN